MTGTAVLHQAVLENERAMVALYAQMETVCIKQVEAAQRRDMAQVGQWLDEKDALIRQLTLLMEERQRLAAQDGVMSASPEGQASDQRVIRALLRALSANNAVTREVRAVLSDLNQQLQSVQQRQTTRDAYVRDGAFHPQFLDVTQ